MSFLCKEFWTQNVIVLLSQKVDPVYFFQNGNSAVDASRGLLLGCWNFCFERRRLLESLFSVVAFPKIFSSFSLIQYVTVDLLRKEQIGRYKEVRVEAAKKFRWVSACAGWSFEYNGLAKADSLPYNGRGDAGVGVVL